MIRVLVVEDEFLVRVGLKTFIPWQEKGFRLIGEAANGREALELLRREACDCILTDICMPEMDGLELLEQVSREFPHIESIILSNHDDFKYLRKALQLGAMDYVLKLTMEPSELEEKLMQIKEKVLKKQNEQAQADGLQLKLERLSKEAGEKGLRDIITKRCSPREIRETLAEFGRGIINDAVYITSIQISCYDEVLSENKFKSEKLLSYSVHNILLEVLKNHMAGQLVELEAGKFTLLTTDCSLAMLEEMRDSTSKYLKLTLSMGVSQPCPEASRLHDAYLEANLALEEMFYNGIGRVSVFSGQAGRTSTDEQPLLSWSVESWARMIAQRDENALLRNLAETCGRIIAAKCWTPEEVKEYWIMVVHQFSRGVKEVGGDIYSMEPFRSKYPYQAIRTAETLAGLQEWFAAWIPLYLQYVKECSNQQWRPEIREVLRLVQELYTTPVKVSELARRVGFTEAYLSVLFKKETGETVIDCIIRHRLQKARELLKSPGIKVYEVSEAVGYTDSNYFAKLFKKMEGIYPLEYRNRYLNK